MILKRYRVLLLAGLAVVGLLGACVALVSTLPQSRYGNKEYDRIRLGMTATEVESVLGPPGRHGPVRRGYRLVDGEGVLQRAEGRRPVVDSWEDSLGAIYVQCGLPEGGVTWKTLAVPGHESLWHRLLRRLGL